MDYIHSFSSNVPREVEGHANTVSYLASEINRALNKSNDAENSELFIWSVKSITPVVMGCNLTLIAVFTTDK